jgi:hypothetical protein
MLTVESYVQVELKFTAANPKRVLPKASRADKMAANPANVRNRVSSFIQTSNEYE